jgi:aspartyl protease family protein
MTRVIHHTSALLLFLSLTGGATAADINLNGVIGNKALLVIDNGKPRWLATGETSPEGVKLISVSGEVAVVESGGNRLTLKMGEGARLASGNPAGAAGNASVVLTANNQGHFFTTGTINGVSVRFLVDTGASLIALSASDARRLGINFLAGKKTLSSTANGVAVSYVVKLDEVRIGDITLNNVDCSVTSGEMPFALLGMSFLNRMEMKRDGDRMTLTKRF